MKKKKKLKLGKKGKDFTGKILKILSKEPNRTFNYKQIAAKLELDDTQSRNQIIKDLKLLKAKGNLEEPETGKYKIIESHDYVIGTIDMTSRRTAYFISDELSEDIFIPMNNLNHALDKDKVKVYIYNRRRGRRPEAEVIEIIERHKEEFVGVINIQKNFGVVTTANPKKYTDILVQKNVFGETENGDVEVEKIV